jgi:hypothetical protein
MAAWLYAERFVGAGSRDYSAFSGYADVSDEFHPQRGGETFSIPTFWVDRSAGTYLRNDLASELHDFYCEDDAFLLPVHPDVVGLTGLYGESLLRSLTSGPPLLVTPTANTRTVFVIERDGRAAPPHFVKLHFPRRLSRFTRRLRRPMIELQLWVSQELSGSGVPYLPEVGGGVLGDHPTESWGYVVREVRPRMGMAEPLCTVPLFALYGQDMFRPDDPVLLTQLIDRSGLSPVDFVGGQIVEPIVRMWLDVVQRTGCIPEMHGQNTLIAFSAQTGDITVLYRDCGIYVDPRLRATEALTNPLPRVNVLGADIDADSAQVRSLAYDSFLGHHVLDRIALLLDERFGIRLDALHQVAATAFRDAVEPAVTMPETVYYYDDLASAEGHGWRLKDTGRKPHWR